MTQATQDQTQPKCDGSCGHRSGKNHEGRVVGLRINGAPATLPIPNGVKTLHGVDTTGKAVVGLTYGVSPSLEGDKRLFFDADGNPFILTADQAYAILCATAPDCTITVVKKKETAAA